MDQSEIFDQSTTTPHKQQQYKKIKVLGQGAMGKAYLVQSNNNQKYYVMKRINIGHLSQQQQQIAMRQAQLHSLVQHQNIIKFIEIYHTTKDKLCIIMQYAENGDLDRYIQEYKQKQNNKMIPQQIILNYFGQICMGLRQIHSKKIIHRDIKGANIFINKDNMIKIGDFGISKIIDQTIAQASKSFVGTPYYLSPQMVQGKPYSTKSDIWSLGVLLYYMCAQKLPFDAQSLPLLALKILRGAFPPITFNYSRELKNLILSMLQVDAKKRPTITEILMKPLLAKYITRQEAQLLQQLKIKQKEKMKQKQINKLKMIKNPTVPNIANNMIVGTQVAQTIKATKKVNKYKNQQQRLLKQKQAKQERKRKRDEQIKQMRDDIRKKRIQAQKDKGGSIKTIQQNLGVPSTQNNTPKINKIPSKKAINVQKSPNRSKPQQQQKKQPMQKPWKMKNKGSSKKDVQIQILVPTIKIKQSKKQPQIPPQIDFQIQIKQYGKKPTYTQVKQEQKTVQHQQKVQNKNNQNQQQQKQQSIQQQYDSIQQEYQEQQQAQSQQQQQQQQQQDTYQQMLNQLNLAQQTIKGLKLKVNKKIQLYEQSQNFDEQQKDKNQRKNKKAKQIQQMNTMEQNTWKMMHNNIDKNNTQILQQGRQIVEEGLGEQKFLKAYNILKEHLQFSQEQKLRGKQLDDYTFNKAILRSKLDFLTDKQFQDYVVWMYTLLLIELEEMKKNFD